MMTDSIVLERYELCIERIMEIANNPQIQHDKDGAYESYFINVGSFILDIVKLRKNLQNQDTDVSMEKLAVRNSELYADILPENYDTSFANPDYAINMLGKDIGAYLCFLYTEIRGLIVYAYEDRLKDMVIHMELFIEIYNLIEDGSEANAIKNVVYYFTSDYLDETITYRTREILDASLDFATNIVMNSDLTDLRYLYSYGEYISNNEIDTARFLNLLPEDKINDMAYTFTNGFKVGFDINASIPLEDKNFINIRYNIGQERMVRAAIKQFEAMGLKPVLYRSAINRVNRKLTIKSGYVSTSPNRQYDYDHRMDEGIFLDKAFVERKIEVLKEAYESMKELAGKYAGPAVIETFGEKPFNPINKDGTISFDDKQSKLSVHLTSENSKILNEYIPQDEYSFTIIAYPLPDIGESYKEIYEEVVKVNTLDVDLYKQVQQAIINELDKAVKVRVVGAGANETDITVYMHHLDNPDKETNFENCLADVNIPVGEVFTSPRLKGTCGILNVSEVYLNEMKYKELTLSFEDGKIVDYMCKNFENPEDNRKFIKDNLLFNRETLPIGEFAIGTNTVAYAMAKKYDILYKLPILIVEKMGPHFAVGDTCYSHSEEVRLYNPDGKELVAKDNECSLLRDEDESKAYFNCHTDITIPYEELDYIESIHEDGVRVRIINKGRFVLEGTSTLNDALDK